MIEIIHDTIHASISCRLVQKDGKVFIKVVSIRPRADGTGQVVVTNMIEHESVEAAADALQRTVEMAQTLDHVTNIRIEGTVETKTNTPIAPPKESPDEDHYGRNRS